MTDATSTTAPALSKCKIPGVCNCQGMPRCTKCNYTAHDAAYHMDHRLCDGVIPGYSVISNSHEREAASAPPAPEPVAAVAAGDVRRVLPTLEEIAESLHKTKASHGRPWSVLTSSDELWDRDLVGAYRLRAEGIRARLAELPAPAAARYPNSTVEDHLIYLAAFVDSTSFPTAVKKDAEDAIASIRRLLQASSRQAAAFLAREGAKAYLHSLHHSRPPFRDEEVDEWLSSDSGEAAAFCAAMEAIAVALAVPPFTSPRQVKRMAEALKDVQDAADGVVGEDPYDRVTILVSTARTLARTLVTATKAGEA